MCIDLCYITGYMLYDQCLLWTGGQEPQEVCQRGSQERGREENNGRQCYSCKTQTLTKCQAPK